MLLNHKFQFISFCHVFHKEKAGGKININDDTHIMHITKGKGTVTIKEQKFNFQRGSIIAVSPFIKFTLNILPNFEMLNIHYKLWLSDDSPLDEHTVLPYVFSPKDFIYIEKILRKMDSLSKVTSLDKLKIASLAHNLVLHHMISNELIPRVTPAIDPRISKAYKKLMSKDCIRYNAGEAAELCCLSVSQMNRKFRRFFGQSPQKLWEKRRFSRVCATLTKTDKPLSILAEEFGFDDHAYFCRWFKKISGYSPLRYRKNSIELNHLF